MSTDQRRRRWPRLTRRQTLTAAASAALGAAALTVPRLSAAQNAPSSGRRDEPIVVHLRSLIPTKVWSAMSSHREAPEMAKDPVADSSDLYAFVTPDRPDTVTLIANYVPVQLLAGGPNFFEFGDDVRYEIHIDNDGDGYPDVTCRFEFTTEITNPNSFRYNTGPIESLDSKNWDRRGGRLLRRPGRRLRSGCASPVPATARGRQEALQSRGRAGQCAGPHERAQHRRAGAAEPGGPQGRPVRLRRIAPPPSVCGTAASRQQVRVLGDRVAADTAADRGAADVLGGDLAGFPNGRRVGDDVVSIALRAIAGVTVPLLDKTFKPDPAAPSESGSVVLDLHGDGDALIIYTGRELHGREIEISPSDRAGPRSHSAVRERHVRDGVFHSAVYPDLAAGRYTVWWDERTAAGSVSVTGGAVAEFVWPTGSSPG